MKKIERKFLRKIFPFQKGNFFANEKESEREKKEKQERKKENFIRNFHQTKVTYFILQSE